MPFCIFFVYIMCHLCFIFYTISILYYIFLDYLFKIINFNICISFCQKIYNILICSSIFKYFKLYFDIIYIFYSYILFIT